MGLDGALDENQAALGAGHGTANSDEIQVSVHLHHIQVLDGDGIAAHLTGADVALEDAAGIGGGAHGAGMTMDRAAAVAHGGALCAVALDGALVAVALAGAGHIHKVTLLEGVGLDDVTDVQLGGVFQVKLAQVLLGGHASLVQVTHFGLGQLPLGNILKAQLDRLITFLLGSLLLNDGAGTRLDNSDGNDLAVFVEDLRHDCFHV